MNIAEATRQAMEKGCYIVRPFGEGSGRIKIKPTNHPPICCVVFDDYGQPHKRWTPKAEDLISEDWKVVEE